MTVHQVATMWPGRQPTRYYAADSCTLAYLDERRAHSEPGGLARHRAIVSAMDHPDTIRSTERPRTRSFEPGAGPGTPRGSQ